MRSESTHDPPPYLWQGGMPREQLLGDFDIVCPNGCTGAVAGSAVEAEMAKVAHEVLLEVGVPLGGAAGAMVQLSHRALTSTLLTICGAPAAADARSLLVAALARAACRRSDDWAAAAARLSRGEGGALSESASLSIQKYFYHPWRAESLPKLRVVLESHPAGAAEREAGLAGLAAVERTLAAAIALGVPSDCLVVDPRINLPADEFPTGVLLQVAAPGFGCLLRAGRFDPLVAACGLGERCAAGLSLYMNRILPTSSFAAPERQASAVDVLVCSSGPGLALERLKLVSELWAAGVRADASHGDDPDLHTQMAQADLLGVPQVAILRKASLLPGGTVVVRTLFGKVRESDSPNIEVERSEVAARIAAKNLPTRSKRAAARKDKEVRSKEAKEEPAPELVAAVRSAGRARAHSSGAANDGRARGGVTSLPVHL